MRIAFEGCAHNGPRAQRKIPRVPGLFGAGCRGLCAPALLAFSLAAHPSVAAIRLMVTVTDQRTGEPVTSLAAGDFLLTDGSSPRRIESAKFETGAVDVMLLVDASLAGQMIQEAAGSMVAQLGEKEQMAVVAFHSTPDLIQDFTSSKQRLTAAIGGIRFGNDPRMLDAVFAGADGGFENSTWRRVIVLITAGIEGRSRVSEASVIRVARKNGVSVFPVFALGYERGMFETLARNTGGAVFSMRDLSKATKAPAARIFEVMRGWYSVMVSGNLALTEKFKLEVKQPGRKLLVSALALD